MATKFEAEVKKGTTYKVDPNDVTFDLTKNRQITEESIEKMYQDFVNAGGKQLTPGACKKNAQGVLSLIFGHRRVLAMRLYNERHPDNKMMFEFRLENVNDEEAFIMRIRENNDRENCSPIDDAINQRYLRETYSYTDTKISEVYGWTQTKVSQYKKLLNLCEKARDLVRSGDLSVQAAQLLAEQDEAKQLDILNEATQEEPATTAIAVYEGNAVQDAEVVDSKPKPKPKKKSISKTVLEKSRANGGSAPRNVSNLIEFFQLHTGAVEPITKQMLFKAFELYAKGKINEMTMSDFVDACVIFTKSDEEDTQIKKSLSRYTPLIEQMLKKA